MCSTHLDARTVTVQGKAMRVYVSGTGPAVIVVTEIPGISPQVARFARWVREGGFTIYMPHLLGDDGGVPTSLNMLTTVARACTSAEFRAFSSNTPGPAPQWLRALAAQAHGECGG